VEAMSIRSSEGSWDKVEQEPEAPSDLEEALTEAQQLGQVSQEMDENIQRLVSMNQKSWFRSIQKLVSLIADAKHEAETLLHDAKSQADQSPENTLFAKNEAEFSLVNASLGADRG
jgi:ribosomal protein S20